MYFLNLIKKIIPKMSFSLNCDGKWMPKSLEDMYPFLDSKLVKSIMKL